MNELAWVIVIIAIWSLIVAMVLSQKGVRTEKSLLRYGVFGYTKPFDRLHQQVDYSTVGLFFYILVTPVILGTQIVLRAGVLIIGKIEDLL